MWKFDILDGLVILFIICVLIVVIFPTGTFVEEDTAITCLEKQGYSEIKVIDKAVWFLVWRGGDKMDSVRFTCKAKNPVGNEVEVYVFSGWLFKASTIRTK